MRYITATQVFSGKEFLPINTILVLNDNGLITDITTKETIESSNIEHFEGIICPGFINTHCHLELSHLKNLIKQHTGIVDFGLTVMKHRNDFSTELQQEAMHLADQEMQIQGIVAVGDISNTNDSIKTKQQSNIYYHTFVELIGLNPERANIVFDTGKQLLLEYSKAQLSVSLAPHAPYSASLELIKKITDNCLLLNKPTSIHNQESKAENEFFNSKTGDYLRLYETIKIPVDYFKPTQKSSMQSVISAFNNQVRTLLVHNTFTNQNDLEIAKSVHSELYWCLCPHANLYIENTLPDIELLISNNCRLTLGTDSLASNTNLSIIEEINCILKHQPSTSIEILLNAATYNGAKFLGIESEFGLIEKNRKGGINLIKGNLGNYCVEKLA
ncbi:MAG: amidohydrolase family protein [Bacteroidia bacterium]|nr:amidohydrolase family protein [Bacteroidia bacterium]